MKATLVSRTDELAQSTVDIHFAGYRNASSCQAAVHVAGNESELCLECRPAYIPEYPVGDAEDCADMIHEFVPIARAIVGLSSLKIISFGPRPCFYQSFSSVHCKRCRETVTAYSYNTNFDFR